MVESSSNIQMKTRSKKSSRASVALNKHYSKDGKYYDTYQLMVAANIRFNQERLKEKGLDQSSFSALKPKTTPTTTPSPRRRRLAAAAALRRSNRKRNAPPENNGLALDDSKHWTDHHQSSAMVRRQRRRPAARTAAPVLTAAQRAQLDANHHTTTTNSWLPAFETYLLQQEGISVANCRSVMRQVEKLVRGEGITYPAHWGAHVCFQKNCPIHLSHDFEALFQQAVDFEETHGRDLGNGMYCTVLHCTVLQWDDDSSIFGKCVMRVFILAVWSCGWQCLSFLLLWLLPKGWLMRHPIRKLENFQRYCHENNSVLKNAVK